MLRGRASYSNCWTNWNCPIRRHEWNPPGAFCTWRRDALPKCNRIRNNKFGPERMSWWCISWEFFRPLSNYWVWKWSRATNSSFFFGKIGKIFFLIWIRNTVTASVATRKMTVSLADSTDLRIILSILYIMTEVMWAEKQDPNSEHKDNVESFSNELSAYFWLNPQGSHSTVIVFRFTDRWRAADGKVIWDDNTILQWYCSTFSDEKGSAFVMENFAGWAWWNWNAENTKR